MTHYQSIIRFLDFAQIDYNDLQALNVSRLKKQVAAEFTLTENGIITIDGFSYSKNDILQEIELPDFPDMLKHHLMIWQHKILLDLLEKDSITFDWKLSSLNELKASEGFADFVSPYFAPAFNSVMKTLLQYNDFANMAVWFGYYDFVSAGDSEIALKNLRIFLDDTLKLFRNVNAQTFRSRTAELSPWYLGVWSRLINALPEELFFYTDEIASALINFTVMIQKENKKMCLDISNRLTELSYVNPSLRQLILNNHEVYSYNYNNTGLKSVFKPKPKQRSGKESRTWFVIMIAIMIVRIAAGGCHNSSASNFKPSAKRPAIITANNYHGK